MRYINTLHEGETIRNVYLCKGKRSAETRNGRPYDNLILQDKTGTLDGKVWDPNSGGIADYDEMDFIEVYGEIISYNNNLQLNIKQIRKAQEGEYIAADYMPTTEKSTDGMYEELLGYIKKVENQYLRQVLEYYFVKDETFIRNFKGHSAAKTVHHGFAEGQAEIKETIAYYMENARLMREGLHAAGFTLYGGVNAPYIWVKAPEGLDSWSFFEMLLHEVNVVGTPGVGFGPSGEGFLRLTAFGKREDCQEAMNRIKNWAGR